ncbi:DDE-type integrase/transposase/recombinase [Paracoccus yeei]|uniref:DDE-type integrase/transposase/recombinase n=1 Tax=Paracoccus yeei TaxID=147645 RepID=UPI0012FD8084|nr:DDE-type integrase/transposase/recombinase [Paracoccus yeei]
MSTLPRAVPAWRLSRHDCVIIDGVPHEVGHATEGGYVLVRPGRDGLSVQISHHDLARRLSEDVEIRRDHYAPHGAANTDAACLSRLGGRQMDVIRRRKAYVQAFLDMEAAGKLSRTDAALYAAMGRMTRAANEIVRGEAGYTGDRKCHVPPSPRTLRRWVRDFERGGGLPALIDGRNRSGRHGSHFPPEARAILAAVAAGYGDPLRPTKEEIHRRVVRAFTSRNDELRAAGDPELPVPSRKATGQAIARLDPFEIDVKRLGQAAALRKHRAVSAGLAPTRLLERVEIDEWLVDLLTLISDMGLGDLLDESGIGDRAKTERLWLSVAIDATSRCIVAMKLDKSPTAATALRTLELVTLDKGPWADAVGALSPWDMHGTPELVVTDCGAAYKSAEFRAACHDLRIAVERAPAGTPWMRPYIERVFRSIGTDLLARLTGRTFGNVLERGDADIEAPAALTADDLGRALIRWVVDVYYNRPHAGLAGRTPLQVWRALSADDQFGVIPPPDARLRRLVFGVRLSRVPQSGGVSVMGVRYQSRELAAWRVRNPGRTLEVRWSPEDLGRIEADFGAGWDGVPAADPRFRGVTAAAWELVVRRVRASGLRSAAAAGVAVNEALEEIDRINDDACRAARVTSRNWTTEALGRAEARLFTGFPALPAEAADARAGDILAGGFVAGGEPRAGRQGGPGRAGGWRLREADDE